MSEFKHTPEPWEVRVDSDNCASIESGSMTVIPGIRDAKHDLERIVACVNTCKHMSTEQLEKWGMNGVYITREPVMRQQADEIARLTAEVERLGKELAEVSASRDAHYVQSTYSQAEVARLRHALEDIVNGYATDAISLLIAERALATRQGEEGK